MLLQRLMTSFAQHLQDRQPPGSYTFSLSIPSTRTQSDTVTPTSLGIENVIGLLYLQPTAGLSPHDLTMFPGYLFFGLAGTGTLFPQLRVRQLTRTIVTAF